MGSAASRTVAMKTDDSKTEKGHQTDNDNLTSWSELDMVDVDCLGEMSEDPTSVLQCVSLPFKLCLVLLLG